MNRMKVTGVVVKDTIRPWDINGSPEIIREILEIDGDYAKVKVGDQILTTRDEGWHCWGTDQISLTLLAVLRHVLGDEFSDYVHNYEFKDGFVYESETCGPFS